MDIYVHLFPVYMFLYFPNLTSCGFYHSLPFLHSTFFMYLMKPWPHLFFLLRQDTCLTFFQKCKILLESPKPLSYIEASSPRLECHFWISSEADRAVVSCPLDLTPPQYARFHSSRGISFFLASASRLIRSYLAREISGGFGRHLWYLALSCSKDIEL